MHEFAVMESLLESVEAEARQHGARQVLAINLVIGERASIVDDSLLFYFDLLTPGTVVENAQLNVRRTTLTFFCAGCNDTYTRMGDNFECPACGAIGQATGEGAELLIESIEIDV